MKTPEETIADIREARAIASDVRSEFDRQRPTNMRERRAATLLLTLADEIERLRPELKPEPEQQ